MPPKKNQLRRPPASPRDVQAALAEARRVVLVHNASVRRRAPLVRPALDPSSVADTVLTPVTRPSAHLASPTLTTDPLRHSFSRERLQQSTAGPARATATPHMHSFVPSRQRTLSSFDGSPPAAGVGAGVPPVFDYGGYGPESPRAGPARPAPIRTFTAVSGSTPLAGGPAAGGYYQTHPLSPRPNAGPGSQCSSSIDAAKLQGSFADAASARHRPLLPESIRDAVHMYLASTGRHDVVTAMLRAEHEAAAEGPADASANPPPDGPSAEEQQRRAVSRKSHDLLRRSFLELSDERHAADAMRGSASTGLLSSHVLPTLYSFEESVQPDLVLLYTAMGERLLLQYARLGLPPPPREVCRYLAEQTKRLMWSPSDMAESIFLPCPANLGTGNVLYGTINQLVCELTRVYITQVPGPTGTSPSGELPPPIPEHLLTAGRVFEDAMLRRHLVFVPSAVLLAKLIERYFVPLSLRFHPEKYHMYGISVDVPDGEEGVPLIRSQGETVYRGTAAAGRGRPHAAADAHSLEAPGPHSPLSHPQHNAGNSATVAIGKREHTVRLITHYSKSGSLWLMICEQIQTKVLTVILQWLTTHPSHFDAEVIHCLLHFVEVCCYAPSRFADCPSKFPQIAEFIRTNCYAILRHLAKKRAANEPSPADESKLPRASLSGAASDKWAARQHGKLTSAVLCTFAMDERAKARADAVPPTLRRVLPSMPTWLSRAEPSEANPLLLPLFAFSRARRSGTHGGGRLGSTAGSGTMWSLADGKAAGQQQRPPSLTPGATGADARLAALERARCALELFSRFSLDEYIRGLTAAHQILFSMFPAPDLQVAALHATVTFQTSPKFQQSYLGIFLKTSTDLTEWATSLLLHAAVIDGERRAAVARRTHPAEPLWSLDDPGPHREGTFDGTASMFTHKVLGPDIAPGLQELLLGTAGRPESVNSGEEGEAASAAGDSLHGASAKDTPLVDGTSFFTTPGLSEAGHHSHRDAAEDGAGGGGGPAGHHHSHHHSHHHHLELDPSVRYFTRVLGRIVDLVVGFLRVNNLHASHAIFRGLRHPFVEKILNHRAVATEMDPHTRHQLRQLRGLYAGSGYGTDRDMPHFADPAGIDPPLRPPEHTAMTLGDYMRTLSDDAEFPTIPAVQYYLRELQRLHAREATFITKHMNEIHPRGSRRAAADSSGSGSTPAADTPVCLVHWRKLRIEDEIIMTVAALQAASLYYISSRATVVRFAAVNVELEQALAEQLDHILVDSVAEQTEMANKLLSTL